MIQAYGHWTYALLLTVVLPETGLVAAPLLPGDSLLFAAGSFAALGSLDLSLLIALLTLAAILGDTVNYAIGHYLGPKVFQYPKARYFNPDHLRQTHQFRSNCDAVNLPQRAARPRPLSRRRRRA